MKRRIKRDCNDPGNGIGQIENFLQMFAGCRGKECTTFMKQAGNCESSVFKT